MTDGPEPSAVSRPRESDLYGPVKRHLEALGYIVRGEVGGCDVVGVREETMIAVELKLSFGLPVLYQALRRLPAVDLVYVAVAVPHGRAARHNWDAGLPDAMRVCRMLGIGLLSVRDDRLVPHADPVPYRPRKQPKTRARLLREFVGRSGDHNLGGTTKRPRVTAYREDALACAALLANRGPMRAASVRDATGVQRASCILRGDVYRWFVKVTRGTYDLAPGGRGALEQFAHVLATRGPTPRSAKLNAVPGEPRSDRETVDNRHPGATSRQPHILSIP